MLLDNIYRHACTLGRKPALIGEGERILWADLWPMAASLAARLRRQGREPVAVAGERAPWVPAAFLACLIAGRPYLPCPPSLPPGRRAAMLERTGAQLLDRAEAERAFAAGEPCIPLEEPGQLAYVLFTSGSTGVPKQVAISLANLEHFVSWAGGLPGLGGAAQGVVAGQAAYTFDLSVADLYLALSQGGTHLALSAEERTQPAALFRRLEETSPRLLVATPSLLRLCLLEREFARPMLPDLEAIFSCGEVLPPRTARQLLERFHGLRLYNAYGPTECTCAVCAAEITPELCAGPLPVGTLSGAAVEISVEDGEIVLRGPSVAPAWGGVYPTGDLGHIRDGALYWEGRRDFQFKYKGYRIDPSEIVAALEGLEGVERAAVLPRRDGSGQVRGITAFVEGCGEGEQLARALRTKLSGYMVPGQWCFLPRLPLNGNGKCDRKALEVLLDGGTDSAACGPGLRDPGGTHPGGGSAGAGLSGLSGSD